MDAAELKTLVEKVAQWADEHPFCAHITLFGSVIRGEEPYSDLDMLLEVHDLRTAGEHDLEDWKQQNLTDFERLRSHFLFPLDIITEAPPDRAKQTRGFL